MAERAIWVYNLYSYPHDIMKVYKAFTGTRQHFLEMMAKADACSSVEELLNLPEIKNQIPYTRMVSVDKMSTEKIACIQNIARTLSNQSNGQFWAYSVFGNDTNFNEPSEVTKGIVWAGQFTDYNHHYDEKFTRPKLQKEINPNTVRYGAFVYSSTGCNFIHLQHDGTDTGDYIDNLSIETYGGYGTFCLKELLNDGTSIKTILSATSGEVTMDPADCRSSTGIQFNNGVDVKGGGSSPGWFLPNGVYQLWEFDYRTNMWLFNTETELDKYLQTGDYSNAINYYEDPAPDYMDLNYKMNSVIQNAVYNFINPKPGILNINQDQIRLEIAVKDTAITKKLIFDLPANTHAWVLFDGKKLYLYADNNNCLFTWGIYVDEILSKAADQRMDKGLIVVDDIFDDYGSGLIPKDKLFNVDIYTNHIFLRQVYYAFSKDEIPVKGSQYYESWQPGTDSTYVRPDGLPDAGGNIVPITTHILSFDTILEMQAASDAEHDI